MALVMAKESGQMAGKANKSGKNYMVWQANKQISPWASITSVSSAQLGVENGRRLFAPKSTCEFIYIFFFIYGCSSVFVCHRECIYAMGKLNREKMQL